MKAFVLLAAVIVALGGCSNSETHTGEQDTTQLPQVTGTGTAGITGNLELGRQVYNFRCYYCHGYSGDARTLSATLLDPQPVNFTSVSPDSLGRERMLKSVTSGRPGTAMMSFSNVLQPHEIAAVVDFIRQEFMVDKAQNTRYHTEENGWSNHERYATAFPFATGKLALDTPWEKLTPEQANGKRLFMASCISCHDRSHVDQKDVRWELRPLSYPRNQFSPGDHFLSEVQSSSAVDAMTSASPYLLHDQPPKLIGLTVAERRGETLFQQNCAFCHAADGTARNWIGSFLESHPRDLTSPKAMSGMTRARLRTVIRDGLAGTSMPAWKSVLSDQQIEDVIAYVGRAFHPLATSTQ